MTTRVNIDHNVGSVIDSIDDVKDDIRTELRQHVGAAMTALWSDTRAYIRKDPDASGNLFRAVKQDNPESVGNHATWTVYVDTEMAAYAAVTEYGSGSHGTRSFSRGNDVPSRWPTMDSQTPIGYPYEAPDFDYNEDNPASTDGYPKFYGFVKAIQEWMEEKNLQPHTGSTFISAAYIAASIVENGTFAHPYLRPAWFDNELQIKKQFRNAIRKAVR